MKKILSYIIMGILGVTVFTACSDDESYPTPTALDASTLSYEAKAGAVKLKWKIPENANYKYIKVTYTLPESGKECLRHKTMYFAKLQNVPTSPRKMRLVADMIRGMEVNRALGVLKFSSKEASARVEKLLRSAIANWEQKNERKAEDGELFVTKIYVDGGAMLKRMRPAPQGRGYRIRKRSNHVTLFVDSKNTNDNQN